MPEQQKYYLKGFWQPEWTEVSKADFIKAERASGFRSRFGDDNTATGGFGWDFVQGRVEYIKEPPGAY